MTTFSTVGVFLYTVTLFCLIFAFKLLFKPLRYIICYIMNVITGCGIIVIVNTFFTHLGFQIAINAVTISICGALGVSGVVFLSLFNLFL